MDIECFFCICWDDHVVFDLLNEIKSLSRVRLFATPWTGAHQVPPSMGFSRQECWNGSPFPSPEDLPEPGFEPRSPALQADALPSEPPGKPLIKKAYVNVFIYTWLFCTLCKILKFVTNRYIFYLHRAYSLVKKTK